MLLPLINRVLAGWRARRAREESQARKAEEAEIARKGSDPTIAKTVASHFRIDGTPVDLASPGKTDEDQEPVPGEALKEGTDTFTQHSILPETALVNPDRQCPLCLAPCGLAEESGGTCVTECGHVFCWSCIQDWGAEKVSLSSVVEANQGLIAGPY